MCGSCNVEEMEFISEVILAMVPAAFFYNPTVACLLIFTTLKLATKNGVYEAIGYSLSVASTPFILIRNDSQAGYASAEYAIQIAANNKRSLGNSKHLFVLFCWHWSRPMKDDTALEIARDAHHLLMQGGDIQMAGDTFYNTIIYLWERGERLETVLEDLEQLRAWALGAPENFRHKVLLLEAEIAKREAVTPRAISRFTQAAAAARQSRFTHECALIHERFPVFWFGLGNSELGEYYARRAYRNYEAWGARRKLRLLQEKHPDLFLADSREDLDLMSVIRAQNVLAQETRIDNLLTQMMQILLEFSGAEKAFLILKEKTWAVEAYKTIDGNERILESIELSESLLPVGMVNYVIRTGQTAELEQFSGLLEASYLRRFDPKSLLVMPVTMGGELIAVISLEHSKIRSMFTEKRQETIRLLSAQIAISLKNARDYNRLEELVSERTAELAQQNEQLVLASERADRATESPGPTTSIPWHCHPRRQASRS